MDSHATRFRGQDQILVFVYGTLQRGEANHGLLARSKFLSETRTCAGLCLKDLGGIPALARGGEDSVSGELYSIDAQTLPALDEYEDHPEYFRRTEIELADGRLAFAYLLPEKLAASFPRLQANRWQSRRLA